MGQTLTSLASEAGLLIGAAALASRPDVDAWPACRLVQHAYAAKALLLGAELVDALDSAGATELGACICRPGAVCRRVTRPRFYEAAAAAWPG